MAGRLEVPVERECVDPRQIVVVGCQKRLAPGNEKRVDMADYALQAAQAPTYVSNLVSPTISNSASKPTNRDSVV